MVDLFWLRHCLRSIPFAIEAQGGPDAPGHGDELTLVLCRICLVAGQDCYFGTSGISKLIPVYNHSDLLLDDAYHGNDQVQFVTDTILGALRNTFVRPNRSADGPIEPIELHWGYVRDRLREASMLDVLNIRADLGLTSQMRTPLWHEMFDPDEQREGNFTSLLLDQLFAFFGAGLSPWSFWYRWYDGMLDGRPLPWDLQREVARIDDAIWEAGPEAVAEEIARIEDLFNSPSDTPVPTNLEEKLRRNAPMLALLQAAGRENLIEAREKLRIENGVEPETRDRLNECLDRLEAALNDLVEVLGLPSDTEDFSARAKKWWRDFCRSNGALSREYSSAENLSKATFPTALILSCTAIGGFFGQPLAGSVVGGLIAQQMKPSQAAKELGKPNETGPN